MFVLGSVENALGISEKIFSGFITDGSIKMNIVLYIQLFCQLFKFLLMFDIFRNFRVVASGNNQFNLIFSLQLLLMFIQKQCEGLQSQIDILLSLIPIQRKKIPAFNFVFNEQGLLIFIELLVKFSQVNRGIQNGCLYILVFQFFEILVENILGVQTVDIDFVGTEEGQFLDQVDKIPIYFFDEISLAGQKFIWVVAVENSFDVEESKKRQDNADLIGYNHFIFIFLVEDQPEGAEEASDICEQTFELTEDSGRDEAEEGAVLVDGNGAVVCLWEGLMVVGGENMWFIVITSGGQAQIDDQLFGSTYSQIGMDEGYLFLHQ